MDRSPEYAATLLAKARGDSRICQTLIGDPDSPQWGIGFHAQQAVEKAIKSVLCAKGVLYPLTHDLARLCGLLRKEGIAPPPHSEQLRRLNRYAVLFRYEHVQDDELGLRLDRSWVRSVLQDVLDWAEPMVPPERKSPEP
jgi:HEPN domain-containing protein